MELRAETLNQALLPPILRELSELIGLRSALALAQAYPGVAVYIPSRPHKGHHLAALVGYEQLVKLSEVYGQESLKLPNTVVRKLKHQVVHDMRSQGKSARKAALATGYTERRVQQICSETHDDRQTDFFTGRE